ncbi:MFS transporter [Morganella morganii]|uniref:MFS transporter n=1 Tax=Morganella morganii TaxID=582 RepID=UPI0013A7372C|nr:MFS transporter [Morganella morganii]HDS7238575.1 MFS transporter [Morganella morganii subsp. morganii]QIC12583.1 MFS transporter [Morganella morganii]HCT3282700.1 MFS transporter [Morganella morganii]HCT7639843.1 MFS transporter [Morganella morganii]HCT7997974.1 MFS transporter [Morganella morganii]
MTNPQSSAWSPLRNRIFFVLWMATLFSNIGTWMNDVGAGWLMTNLSPDPVMIATIQAMTTLPVFLLALPAGAIADIFDKRKLLIFVNIMMFFAAALLAVLVYFNVVSIGWLLLITFILGSGAAFLGPAWQAIVPGIVAPHELKAGIALNSMGINISRAIGPALAGVLISQVGLYLPFMLNALSFIAIIVAVWWWKGEKHKENTLPAESVVAAMISGLRYARYSPALIKTIIRAAAFFVFASAYWAMLPLVARVSLQGDATLYGILTTSIGIGAVAGAFSLSALRARFSTGILVTAGTAGTVIVLVIFAVTTSKYLAIAGSIIAGFSWLITLSTLMVSAQTALPDWVRARGLALYLTVFSGSMALGSLIWGQIASHTSITIALLAAAAGIIVVWLCVLKVKIDHDNINLSPSEHLTMPEELPYSEEDKKPVMVCIQYKVDTEHQAQFFALMEQLKRIRLRDGGYSRGLFSVPGTQDEFMETFMVSSPAEHHRQHKRATVDDRRIDSQLNAIIRSKTVVHYLSYSADTEKQK